MWNEILKFTHRCYHALSSKSIVDLSRSPERELIDKRELRRRVASLRENFRSDGTPEVLNDLRTTIAIEAQKFAWYQRIKIPNTRAYTTSDRTRQAVDDPGWLNRLGNVLTSTEGSILRPLPKWQYIQNVLPDLSGKSVMEIGSNNGFFCFEFANLGARKVTGIDVQEEYISAAQWMSAARGEKNITFLRTDALLDFTIEPHQVVFMSETYTHFVDPLFGILRALNLAEQTLIIDGPALTYGGTQLNLSVCRDSESGRPSYIAWTLNDGLLIGFLSICGIEPERVTRFASPLRNHRVYVIDATDVATSRRRDFFAGKGFLQTAFKTAHAACRKGLSERRRCCVLGCVHRGHDLVSACRWNVIAAALTMAVFSSGVSTGPLPCNEIDVPGLAPPFEPTHMPTQLAQNVAEFQKKGITLIGTNNANAARWRETESFDLDTGNRHVAWDWAGRRCRILGRPDH
jgi:hypothetical protein